MCTTIGFKCEKGFVFGRTLEIGMPLDHDIMYVPQGIPQFVRTNDEFFTSKYAILGTAFSGFDSFGDAINEHGLMGSSNFFPGYGSFNKESRQGKKNFIMSEAFDYILSHCKDVTDILQEIEQINLVETYPDATEFTSMSNHFFFMDKEGHGLVLEPFDGKLQASSNPYGVLTNAPEFQWHVTNLKNTIQFQAFNVESSSINGIETKKLGEGTGLLGLPGDFTPPSRFIRAAHFVSLTPKDLAVDAAILQGYRILSQFDIPKGSVIDPYSKLNDETLYTSMINNQKMIYTIKCHDNINIQSFSMADYQEKLEITRIKLKKHMTF